MKLSTLRQRLSQLPGDTQIVYPDGQHAAYVFGLVDGRLVVADQLPVDSQDERLREAARGPVMRPGDDAAARWRAHVASLITAELPDDRVGCLAAILGAPETAEEFAKAEECDG
jgi:hypothetical protein